VASTSTGRAPATRMAAVDRRQQIVSVASELFSKNGFNGTTTKEIADRAGVSEAIIFRHFPTKQALYSAIIDFKTALLASPELIHGLRTLRCGKGQWDAADALSGYRFEILMEVARELFDLVLVAGSHSEEAASHVLSQRVDSVILVTSAGHTVTRSVEAADREFAIRRATLLGVILLRRRRNKVTRWASTHFRSWLWRGLDRFAEWRQATFNKSDEIDE